MVYRCLDTRDLACCECAEATTRRLEAQLAESAERNRRVEHLSQVNTRKDLLQEDIRMKHHNTICATHLSQVNTRKLLLQEVRMQYHNTVYAT